MLSDFTQQVILEKRSSSLENKCGNSTDSFAHLNNFNYFISLPLKIRKMSIKIEM